MRARLASILLLTLVATGSAAAENRAAKGRVGKVTLRVAQVFPETGQALVLDKTTGRHLVVSEGDTVGKYQIVEVGDDEVVVRAGTRELVLPADEPAKTAPEKTAEGPLLDPYATAPEVGTGPKAAATPLLDPYAPEPIREVLAPPTQRAVPSGGPVARPSPVGSSPDGSPSRDARLPGSEAPLDPYAESSKPTPVAPKPAVVTPVPTTPAPAVEAIRVDAMTIKRSELSSALSDFDRLSKSIGFTRTATGVRLGKIDAGTYFHGLGLRSGDVVTAIDGAPLRGLDDAAGAYARLGSAKKLTLDVERAGARGTLRFALK